MHATESIPWRFNWDEVRLFLALGRSRTVGEAAGRLGVDASTVSRRLAALEDGLGAALFDRGRSGLTPTEAAEDLLPIAEQIEAGIARFAGAAETLDRAVAGLVRITCPADAGDVLIVPHLAELLERYPGLRIELLAGEAVVDLARREADIALRTKRPTHGDLVVTRVLSVPWKIAASPALARKVKTLRAWTDVPWIGPGARLAEAAPGRWFRTHVQGVEPALRSDSLRAQITMAETSAGVAILPGRSVEHFGLAALKVGKKLQPAVDALPVDDLFLVTHRSLRDVPRVRVVWEFLKEAAQGSGARKRGRTSRR